MDRFFTVDECGPVLCGSASGETSILDRDSLAELWHTGFDEFLAWTGCGMLVLSQPPRLLDKRTGQIRIDLSGWTVVSDLSRSFVDHDAMLPVMTQRVDQRTYVARLTPQGIRVLGAIPQWLRDCGYHEGLLACTTADGGTGVWRLRAS